MFDYSGKDYNDFGRYHDCVKEKDLHYVLGTVADKFPISMSIGMCVPKVCTIQDFFEFGPYIVASINKAIPTLFRNIKGLNPNTVLNANDLVFYNSEVENAKANEIDFGVVFIITFMIILVILVIIGTVFYAIRRRKLNLHKEESLKRKKLRKLNSPLD